MHMDMNMSMSMHMRMGTTTNMAIASGTSIDLELNPYETAIVMSAAIRTIIRMRMYVACIGLKRA